MPGEKNQDCSEQEEYHRRYEEGRRRAAAGKVVIREARNAGVPVLLQKAGPHNDRAFLVQVGPNGRPWVAQPGFDKASRELLLVDVGKPEEWFLENATPEIRQAWAALLSESRVTG